ncbi:MAG: HAD-IIIA family hydrolase [Chloroflexi bacterium]|nr:HAD-IIIA family hydrolase [Chloroflexota bacterium]
MTARNAVFLDRDGVLVREIVIDGHPFAPVTLEAFELLPEAAAQIQRLRDAGFLCIVFTNQPEMATGELAADILDTMHGQLRATVPVDDIYVCPHRDADQCACRKPLPGMLTAAAEKFGVDLKGSFVIGDRWRDIEAGRTVGCYSILIERPYSACETADARVDTLTEAVEAVLAQTDQNRAPSKP